VLQQPGAQHEAPPSVTARARSAYFSRTTSRISITGLVFVDMVMLLIFSYIDDDLYTASKK
jgi:hypothetical protein